MNRRGDLLSSLLRIPCSVFSPSGANAKLTILTYHRVLPSFDPLIQGEVISADFDWHMMTLSRNFNVISLPAGVEGLRSGTLPARAVCVTFDDGYADNVHIAMPVLQKWGVSATFFIAVGFLDSGTMWNDTIIESIRVADGATLSLQELDLGEHDISNDGAKRQVIRNLISKLKYSPFEERAKKVQALTDHIGKKLNNSLMMTSDEVVKLKNAGMEFGAHTINHPILSKLQDKEAEKEINDGKNILQDIIGCPVTMFAYPNGRPGQDYEYRHVEMVKRAGFDAAVTTAWGYGRMSDDMLQLPRITQWSKTPFRFALQILRNYRSAPALQLNR